ncbi:PREDICTED: protein-lysine N-methyltransferase N6AMT2 [Gekko japonicus]|uniref:Protein-lysine N-methyltransferase N6AMT2 n=1 Tax=Gekko japonicus TaxID=146911 RepID=A0ABM1LG89_GEKJA|nr:PREDICTED: protein-lysine N-methyltransferase N6AMT2 [Gekko japonicus]
MSDTGDYDDVPQLSSQALAALQEFYIEQQQKNDIRTTERCAEYSLGSIEENWKLSQFWYDSETALRLANEAIQAVGKGGSPQTEMSQAVPEMGSKRRPDTVVRSEEKRKSSAQ